MLNLRGSTGPGLTPLGPVGQRVGGFPCPRFFGGSIPNPHHRRIVLRAGATAETPARGMLIKRGNGRSSGMDRPKRSIRVASPLAFTGISIGCLDSAEEQRAVIWQRLLAEARTIRRRRYRSAASRD